MNRTLFSWLLLWAATPVAVAADLPAGSLPSPLGLEEVIRIASERRDEIEAARALSRAAEERPAIVSALEDPMISPSIDHLPFTLEGVDASLSIEQRFPLSPVRRHRRDSALADLGRLRAEVERASLDVALEAAGAFLMLQELRRSAALLDEQISFARELVNAANSRYAGGTAPQSDVLRAEVEVARLEARARALVGLVRGAEAMLNASLALDTDQPVPPLAPVALVAGPPDWASVEARLSSRPELDGGRAEIARAEAEVEVMRDMYRPMALVRTGPSYTMGDGSGWMAMVGFSLPIWRSKLRAGVAEATAMQSMAEADLRAMTRMIEGEAAVAVAEVESAYERRNALELDVLPRARMAIDPAVASYASGQLPLVSVIEAIQALWLVQSDLIAADTQLGLAWTRLARATGSYEGLGR